MDTKGLAHRKTGQRGVALAVAFMVVGALVTLSTGFVASTVAELRAAQYYKNSTKAFWVASSGIDQFISDTHYLDSGTPSYNVGGYEVTFIKTDEAARRTVQAFTTIGGVRRGIEITYPALPPDLFSNTMTSGNNFNLTGLLARLDVYGKTRIGANYNQSGFLAAAYFEDKKTGQGAAATTLKYPDTNGNGVPDEFADFVQFYRNECNRYTATEAEHVAVGSGESVIIYPNKKNMGKRIIFVEGPGAGDGDVDIIFDASWRSSEDLTIVSTGSVNYIQPLQIGADSKLNIVSWDDYNEASILYSAHDGITYTHKDANFYSVLNYSVTEGLVVANRNINAMEALTWKLFNYSNPIDEDGNLPAGFAGLIAQSAGGYVTRPATWKEI